MKPLARPIVARCPLQPPRSSRTRLSVTEDPTTQMIMGAAVVGLGIVSLQPELVGLGAAEDAAAVARIQEPTADAGANRIVGATGQIGQQWLAQNLGGESQVDFRTSQGARFVH